MKTKKIITMCLAILISYSGQSLADEAKAKKKVIQIEVDEDSEVVEVKKEKGVQPIVERESEDPASSRVIYGPTALPNTHVKKFRLTSFNLGLWNIDYAANENINIGVETAPPFGVFLLGVKARYNVALADNVHFGLQGNGGVMGVFAADEDGVSYYGGGPMLTIGNHRKSITFSSLTYGAMWNNHSGYVVLPGVAGSIQVSNRVKFNLEGYSFITPGSHKKIREGGAILYGLRIFSETGSVFGDINFLVPVYKGMGDLLSYMPLGIPVLAFGFAW